MIRRVTKRSYFWAFVAMLSIFLIGSLTGACAINRELVGSWRLIQSEDESFVAGMIFNFNDDRTLLIKPGDAELDPDKKAQYILSGDEIKITYTSSPDGSLSLNMRKRDKKTVTIKMHYVLEEDLLQITDEYEVTLTLLRRP